MSNRNLNQSDFASEVPSKPIGIEGLRNLMAQPDFIFLGKSELPFSEDLLDQYLQGDLQDERAIQVEQAILCGDMWGSRFSVRRINRKLRTGEISKESLAKFDEIIGFQN